jgi:hypothetical protein
MRGFCHVPGCHGVGTRFSACSRVVAMLPTAEMRGDIWFDVA